jgi:hypothetical protein
VVGLSFLNGAPGICRQAVQKERSCHNDSDRLPQECKNAGGFDNHIVNKRTFTPSRRETRSSHVAQSFKTFFLTTLPATSDDL